MNQNQTGGSGIALAMDTSGNVCSVAALRNGQLCSEHTFRHGMHLSEDLIAHVEAVLRDAECELTDVEIYAVGIGPGSFTGTRIGVMTIKTFAIVHNRPTYGVDGLEAMAMEYAGTAQIIVPILPCRAATVYAGIYAVADGKPNVIATPAAIPLAALIELLPIVSSADALFCGEAVERYHQELVEAVARAPFSIGSVRYPQASVIGEIAWRRRLAGDTGDDATALVPLYISPPPISLPKTAFPVAEKPL